jgi:hypothetical protein
MVEWGVVAGRLVPYWVVVACSLWILFFLYAWTNDPGYVFFETFISAPVSSNDFLVNLFVLGFGFDFLAHCSSSRPRISP